jgi:uncharacterized protein YjiS (DUF1127 family)
VPAASIVLGRALALLVMWRQHMRDRRALALMDARSLSMSA